MKRTSILILIYLLFHWMDIQATNSFKLIDDNVATSIYYAGSESVINTAIDMLIADSKLVCDIPFRKTDQIVPNAVLVGIPNKEPYIKDIAERCKLDISALSGKWEAFQIHKIHYKDGTCLLVLGSDPRGTAYGVLELSRQLGVSPWVWWADVMPEKKKKLLSFPMGLLMLLLCSIVVFF